MRTYVALGVFPLDARLGGHPLVPDELHINLLFALDRRSLQDTYEEHESVSEDMSERER